MSVRLALIDSGFRPSKVYRFCRDRRRRKRILPAKGASTRLETFVQRRALSDRTSSPGQKIALVDTSSTQDWLDESLHGTDRGAPRSTTLFAASLADHQDFLEQLLNDAPVGDVGPDGNYRERWERIDPHVPNDYRDCKRYALAAMKLLTRGASLKPRKMAQSTEPAGAGTPRFIEIPD